MASNVAGPSRGPLAQEGVPDDDGTQLSYNETIEALCAFMKTAIHTILCHRQLYPANVFTRKQRYRVPVWASRHPGLNAYIDDVMAAVKTQLQRSLVRSVHVVLSSATTRDLLERYRFDVDFILRDVALRDRDFSIPGNMNVQSLELQLRAFMMKLISIDGALYDIESPEDVTWAVVLDMKDGSVPQTSDTHGNEPEQGLWVPFDDGMGVLKGRNGQGRRATDAQNDERPEYLHAMRSSDNGEGADDSLIVPVKSLDTGVINLMLYVEEHPAAKRRPASTTTKAATPQKTPTKIKTAKRKSTRVEDATDEEARYGERDIDEPLPLPSSSGAAAKVTKSRSKRKAAQSNVKDAKAPTEADTAVADLLATHSDDSSDSEASRGSSGSGDSIRSVNDFAGYGKGPGGVGMSGVGM